MTSPSVPAREALLAQLLAERYAAPRPVPVSELDDPAGPEVYVQRQRALCEALDGRHLTVVDDHRAAA